MSICKVGWRIAKSIFFCVYLFLFVDCSMSKAKRMEDVTWKHCKCVEDGNKNRLRCNYCSKEFSGGVFRMKHHLARTHSNAQPCARNPDECVALFKNILKDLDSKKRGRDDDLADFIDLDDTMEDLDILGGGSKSRKVGAMDSFVERNKKPTQTTLNAHWKKNDREEVCMDIARFWYANALAFNCIKCPYFAKMMDSVAKYGIGLKLPSYHEIRNTFLQKEVGLVQGRMEVFKQQWKRTGCTIMSDGWTDTNRRSIINFLVNSPRGTVFLKSIDVSNMVKTSEFVFSIIDEVVEEVGEDNVVQVVTDSAQNYVGAGKMLMDKREKLFWTPCGAHVIDLMLEDIGELRIHRETCERAKEITKFIYAHSIVLNIMRDHTKGKELLRPAVTRFATKYLTLKSILENRSALKRMFTSQDWEDCSFSRVEEGLKVERIILNDDYFWKGVKYCLKSTLPLVKVLRLLDGDAKPAMGYVYEAMDEAKEMIAKNFGKVASRYEEIWKIIDERWEAQLHRPLHGAGFYLNPKYQYDPKYVHTSDNVDADEDVMYEARKGLFDCIERMVPNKKDRAKISKQLDIFTTAIGEFGRAMAIESRKTKQPGMSKLKF